MTRDMAIEIKSLPVRSWISERYVMNQNEPDRMETVIKYVISRLLRILPKEKPMFCHFMSSGYGARDIFRSIGLPFLPLSFNRAPLLQQEIMYRSFDGMSFGFNS